MRPLILAAALSLLAGANALAASDGAVATNPDNPEAHYQALLAAAKASAPNSDWLDLRLAFAERPSFRVFAQSEAKRQMLVAADKSDCATALPAAKAVLAEAYVDIDAHMVAAFCEDLAGDNAAAQLDRDIGAGLVASVKTGDGLTPATAFTPIDVGEEYAVLRALGARITQQQLVQSDGHSYDALTAVGATGRPATYYFLIDRVLAAESTALKPGDVSEGGPPDRTP